MGVAAGTPRHDSMILWTRLAPEPLAEDGHGGMTGGDVRVAWEVAKDEGFEDVVKQGEALAQRELAHSVHPQVTGLEPATEYFYRFRVDGKVSPVGRFKTLPAPGAKVDDFTFTVAFVSGVVSRLFHPVEAYCAGAGSGYAHFRGRLYLRIRHCGRQ